MSTKNRTHVTALHIHPIRSCAPLSLQRASLTEHGFTFDRQWRLIGADSRFLTQREVPKMALLCAQLLEGRLQIGFGEQEFVCDREDLTAGGVSISDVHAGIDQGDEVAAWFKTVLGTEARLLRVVNKTPQFAPGSTDFAKPDMAPVLIISEESLADLNSRLDEPVRMNRFRPNIVVRGVTPYAEDAWGRIRIAGIEFKAFHEPCGRCPMIDVNQETGEKSKGLLKTLSTYRRIPGAVVFGKYMVPCGGGSISLGDEVFTDFTE